MATETETRIDKALKLLRQQGLIVDNFTWNERGKAYLKTLGENPDITPYSYARKLALL
jgi:predicted phosphatase